MTCAWRFAGRFGFPTGKHAHEMPGILLVCRWNAIKYGFYEILLFGILLHYGIRTGTHEALSGPIFDTPPWFHGADELPGFNGWWWVKQWPLRGKPSDSPLILALRLRVRSTWARWWCELTVDKFTWTIRRFLFSIICVHVQFISRDGSPNKDSPEMTTVLPAGICRSTPVTTRTFNHFLVYRWSIESWTSQIVLLTTCVNLSINHCHSLFTINKLWSTSHDMIEGSRRS